MKMNSIHFLIFMIFPTFLFGNESEKIEKKLNEAWNCIHEMPGHKTSLWNEWFCKHKTKSKCQKVCAKCQEHYAKCHNAKCGKENCEKCQNHRGECHISECKEHLKECQEWKEIAEKILALILRWDEVKTRAKLSAAKQIEEASKNGNCDGKCKKLIEEEWRKSMLDTLLTDNANGYMEFIQQNNDNIGTITDAPIALSLHLALKTVDQANVALMDDQQMPGLIRFKDEAQYFQQMNKWKSWMAQTSAMEKITKNWNV